MVGGALTLPRLALVALALLATPSPARGGSDPARANAIARRAIYGPDSREDENSGLVSDFWRGIGSATVVLVRPQQVRSNQWGDCGRLDRRYPCGNGAQRFADQQTCGFCSGTAIAPEVAHNSQLTHVAAPLAHLKTDVGGSSRSPCPRCMSHPTH